MNIRWTVAAVDHLASIHARISKGNGEERATAIVKMLHHAAESLAKHPRMGRTGRKQGTRELVRAPWVIVYRIVEDTIHVLNVYHGSEMY